SNVRAASLRVMLLRAAGLCLQTALHAFRPSAGNGAPLSQPAEEPRAVPDLKADARPGHRMSGQASSTAPPQQRAMRDGTATKDRRKSRPALRRPAAAPA